MEYFWATTLLSAAQSNSTKCLKMMVLLAAFLTLPVLSKSSGMPWYRECSSNHEVTLNADEGIIETPAPDVYGSNCGGPIHPGICCRWRINVTNSKMRVQISILDSTLPIKRSGRCYKDNVITIVDSDNQKVDNLCGPVGLAQTVIVPTAGASIGFTGLLKDRAMATLHYKIIGCKEFPHLPGKSSSVEGVKADSFSANLTCASGHIQRYRCIGRTWHPRPEDNPCARYTSVGHSPITPASEPWLSGNGTVNTTESQFTTPTSTVDLYNIYPGASPAGNKTLPIDGGTERKMGKILLALIVLGSVSAILLIAIILVTVLRQITHRRPRYQQTQPSEPTSLTDQGFYADLYEEIENQDRLISPANCLTSLSTPVNCRGGEPAKPPCSNESTLLEAPKDNFQMPTGHHCESPQSEMDTSTREAEASYAIPDKKRRSGLVIIENDIYEEHGQSNL